MKLILAMLVLAGCGQMQKQSEREPSSDKMQKALTIQQCGEIEYSEDNRVARDREELMYSLKLDCNRDRKITDADKNLIIGIALEQIRPQQKSWLTRWKRQAVLVAQNAKANPYLCMQVEVSEDPCQTGRSVFGVKPQFTSRIYNLQSAGEK